MKPKILIISYDAQPLRSIAAKRVDSWVPGLSNYGIYPVLITRNWQDNIRNTEAYFEEDPGEAQIFKDEQAEIHRYPYKHRLLDKALLWCNKKRWFTLRKALTFLQIITKWLPFTHTDKAFLYEGAKKALDKGDISAILVSGEPFILFKYAYLLSKQYKVPFFLDYRDAWYTNPFRQDKGLYKFIKQYEYYFESLYLKNAKGFTTVSSIIADEINAMCTSPVQYTIIENGFEIKQHLTVQPIVNTGFSVVYTGTFYEKQPFDIFLEGFKLFQQQVQGPVQLFLIGINFRQNPFEQQVKAYQTAFENLTVIDSVSNETAIAWQLGADVLLKLGAVSPVKGFYGGKMYEYIAARRPILNVIPPHVDKYCDLFPGRNFQILTQTPEEVADALLHYYNTKIVQGVLSTDINDADIFSISRDGQTRKLAEFILQSTKESHS
jgi:glycosyltransferase involved in cell wall biosynthesis